MTTISVVINARTTSSRLPKKLVLPFAGSTLVDIALQKLNSLDFFEHRYFAVAEQELKDRMSGYSNIQLLERDPEAVKPGYNDHRKVFSHYQLIDSDYILWLNPCHPLLSAETLRNAVDYVKKTMFNSYTSVIPTTDWIFNDQGEPITNTKANMLSTAHSQQFYKVAHAFHVINKQFFLKNYQYWTLAKNDPALIQIPVEESPDVNDEMEFQIAEAAYLKYLGTRKLDLENLEA